MVNAETNYIDETVKAVAIQRHRHMTYHMLKKVEVELKG